MPVGEAVTPVARTVYAGTKVAAEPCTCLTKTYTPEGVLFRDVCTKEAALAPIEGQQANN